MMPIHTDTTSANSSSSAAQKKSNFTVEGTEKNISSDNERKNGSTSNVVVSRRMEDSDAAAGAASGFYAYHIPTNGIPLTRTPRSTIVPSSSVKGSTPFQHKDGTEDMETIDTPVRRKPVEVPAVERQWLHLPGPSASHLLSSPPTGFPLCISSPPSLHTASSSFPASRDCPSPTSYQWCRRDQFWRQYDTAQQIASAVVSSPSSPSPSTTTDLPLCPSPHAHEARSLPVAAASPTRRDVLPALLLSMEPRPLLAMCGLSALQGPLASRLGPTDPPHVTDFSSSSPRSPPQTNVAPFMEDASSSSLVHSFFTVTPEEYAVVMAPSSPTEVMERTRSTPEGTTKWRENESETKASPTASLSSSSASTSFAFDYGASCKLLTLFERFGNPLLVHDRWATTDATGMGPRVSSDTSCPLPRMQDVVGHERRTTMAVKSTVSTNAKACGGARKEEEEGHVVDSPAGTRIPLSTSDPTPTVEDVFIHYQQLTSRVMAYRLALLQDVLQSGEVRSSSASFSSLPSTSPLHHPLLSAMQKHPFLSHPLLQRKGPPSRGTAGAEGGTTIRRGDREDKEALSFSFPPPSGIPSRAALHHFFSHNPQTALAASTTDMTALPRGRSSRDDPKEDNHKRNDAAGTTTHPRFHSEEERPSSPFPERMASHPGAIPQDAEDWSPIHDKRRHLHHLLALEADVQVVRTRAREVYAALLPRAAEVLQRASTIWHAAVPSFPVVGAEETCLLDAIGSTRGGGEEEAGWPTEAVCPPPTPLASASPTPFGKKDAEAAFHDILRRTATSLRSSVGPLGSPSFPPPSESSLSPTTSDTPLLPSAIESSLPSRVASSPMRFFPPPPSWFVLDPRLVLHAAVGPCSSSPAGDVGRRKRGRDDPDGKREEEEEEEDEEGEAMGSEDDEETLRIASSARPSPTTSSRPPTPTTRNRLGRGRQGRGRRRKRGRGRCLARTATSQEDGTVEEKDVLHTDHDSLPALFLPSSTTPLTVVCEEVGDHLPEAIFRLERMALAGWVLPPLPPLEFPPPLLVVEKKEEEEEGKRAAGKAEASLLFFLPSSSSRLPPHEEGRGSSASLSTAAIPEEYDAMVGHPFSESLSPSAAAAREGGGSSSLQGGLSDRVCADTPHPATAPPPPPHLEKRKSPPRRARGRGAWGGRGRGRRGGGQEVGREVEAGGGPRPSEDIDTTEDAAAAAAAAPPPPPLHVNHPSLGSWPNDPSLPRPRREANPKEGTGGGEGGGGREGGEGSTERMRVGGGETAVEDAAVDWPPEPYLRQLKDMHSSGWCNRAHSHLGEAVQLSLPRTAGIPVAFREVEEELEKHLWEHPYALMEGDHPIVASLVSHIRLLLLQNKAWRKHAQKWEGRVLDGLLKIKEESEAQQRLLEAYYNRRGHTRE